MPLLWNVEGEHVLFKHQVDNFEMATSSERIPNILFDKIDKLLTFPLKRMGLVTVFNGIDVLQTWDYVKILVQMYIEPISEKHLNPWMTISHNSEYPTPLPHQPEMMQDVLNVDGSTDEKVQNDMAKLMRFGYRNGIGELIYDTITCRPDLLYTVVRCSQ